MAIQISDHKLSLNAKKYLNNAKNKSQFLRDAIEFYVTHLSSLDQQGVQSVLDQDMKNEIKEIKEMLENIKSCINLSAQHISETTRNEVAISYKDDNLNTLNTNRDISIKEENAKDVNEDNEIEKMIDASLSLF